MKYSDGSVLSYAHRMKTRVKPKNKTFELLRARVDDVIYVDDPRSRTQVFVEYNIIIDGSSRDGTMFSNVPMLQGFSGFNNHNEVVLSPTTDTSVSKPTKKLLPPNRTVNGSYVAVLFLQGTDEYPVIVGAWPHPRLKGASKDDGVRMKGEFNGIEWTIDKDGAFTVQSLGGPRDPKGNLLNAARGVSAVNIDADGIIRITRSDKSSIEISDDEIVLLRNGSRIKIDSNFIDLDDGGLLTPLDGVVTGMSIDPFTNIGHIDFSTKVRAKK